MYKVILIDDEAIIVEGLKRVVDWSAHGCQVAATASDALSGSAAIRKHCPDIVFTDIKMPGEDGLVMLAGLKAEFPRMMICVLTGYRDFDYAHRAIQLGVSRFLLKPSRMDELEEALNYMTSALGAATESSAEGGAETAASCFIARQAQSYISEHYWEHLSLQDVAEHCYVSQWHLSKLLNKQLGQTFYELLNQIRISKAKELMEQPALRISEIAEKVGYADTAHFSRVFKKTEGVSAGDWRNRHCCK